jgi:thioredoxin reductase (NADPH)
MEELYDIIIIGGGPGGSTAAIYTSRAKLRTLVLDRLGRGGTLAVTGHIANYPGVPGPIPGMQLVESMQAQARAFGAEYRAETVIATQLTGEIKTVYTNEGSAFRSRAVVVAAGALERKTKIAGEEALWGHGVSACAACDGPFYQDKTVVVTGSDNYAAEEALSLTAFATQVHFATPALKTIVSAATMAELVAHPAITVHLGWALSEIFGEQTVQAARFTTHDGTVTLATDGVFLYLGGARPSTSFLQQQLPYDADGAILTGADQSTAIPGVYAVGDITAHPFRQSIIAAGEGCVAALAVQRYLRDPRRCPMIA